MTEEFKKWVETKINEELEAWTFYEILGTLGKSKREKVNEVFKKVPEELATELRDMQDLRKHFLEHSEDEENHKKILVEIRKAASRDKPKNKDSKLEFPHTVRETLLYIMYDEASAVVEYIEGIRKHWAYLGKDIETRAKILGIVVDELEHLSDTVIELKKLYKEFDQDNAWKSMPTEKSKNWQEKRIWEKAAAALFVVHALAHSAKNSLSELTKKKMEEIVETKESPFYGMATLNIALGRTRGSSDSLSGIFVLRPYEGKTEDVLRFGDISTVDANARRPEGEVFSDLRDRISMEPDKRTTVGIVLKTTDAQKKFIDNDSVIYDAMINESKKPANYSRSLFALKDTNDIVWVATREDYPKLTVNLTSNLGRKITTYKRLDNEDVFFICI